MSALDDTDRTAVLLRYFENKSLREVGATLGTSDDAAQKRVSRAVERLREFFAKHGVTIGASGLVVVISANAVQAAPVGLAVTISTAAAFAGTTIVTTTTMNWINAKVIAAIVASALVAGTATRLVQQRETNRLHKENQSLIAQQASLQTERDAALSGATVTNDELERLRKEKSELPRLRGEVAMLRKQTNEFGKLREQNRQLGAGPVSAPSQSESSPDGERDKCINNLRQIDGAMQQCALENRLTATNVLTAEQILPYIGRNSKQLPHCPSGGIYTFGNFTIAPTCSIPSHALAIPVSTPSEVAASEAMAIVMEAYKRDHNGRSDGDDFTEAVDAYKRDHNGQAPKGIPDLTPYLKPPSEQFRKAMDAYKRDHNGQEHKVVTDLAPYLKPATNSESTP